VCWLHGNCWFTPLQVENIEAGFDAGIFVFFFCQLDSAIGFVPCSAWFCLDSEIFVNSRILGFKQLCPWYMGLF